MPGQMNMPHHLHGLKKKKSSAARFFQHVLIVNIFSKLMSARFVSMFCMIQRNKKYVWKKESAHSFVLQTICNYQTNFGALRAYVFQKTVRSAHLSSTFSVVHSLQNITSSRFSSTFFIMIYFGNVSPARLKTRRWGCGRGGRACSPNHVLTGDIICRCASYLRNIVNSLFLPNIVGS